MLECIHWITDVDNDAMYMTPSTTIAIICSYLQISYSVTLKYIVDNVTIHDTINTYSNNHYLVFISYSLTLRFNTQLSSNGYIGLLMLIMTLHDTINNNYYHIFISSHFVFHNTML